MLGYIGKISLSVNLATLSKQPDSDSIIELIINQTVFIMAIRRLTRQQNQP
jgi:hypothetical protein